MKKYKVVFSEEAKQDIIRSLRWGREHWGDDVAVRWFREIRSVTRKILAVVPLGQPVAPESNDVGREIRHLMIGRYRLLFEVARKTVNVIHVVGPYVDPEQKFLDSED